jgi:predicted DNA-binding protein (UPF0251 family)
MRNRTRMIAAGAAVTAALAAGSGAAIASSAGGKPSTPANTTSATGKPSASTSAGEQQGHDAITAAVARTLHLSTARVSAALAPLFAAGYADTSSSAFAAAARSLGVSTQQLAGALTRAKLSLAGATAFKQRNGGAKASGSKSQEEQQGHNAMTAAVARALHLSTARVSTALAPVYAAGHADTSSPVFVAAAHSLGVSAQQLATALASAKQSLANAQ